MRLKTTKISQLHCHSGGPQSSSRLFGEATPRRLRRSLNPQTSFKARIGKAKLFRKAGGRAAHFVRPFRLKLASSGHLS
jgi:hypothetical protein